MFLPFSHSVPSSSLVAASGVVMDTQCANCLRQERSFEKETRPKTYRITIVRRRLKSVGEKNCYLTVPVLLERAKEKAMACPIHPRLTLLV
jgi:hypothetical protein